MKKNQNVFLSQKATSWYYVIGLMLAGFFILTHRVFYQPIFTNEHNLNLYAINEVAKGRVPCIDFFWPYGPLGLYYYGFFFKIFGSSVLIVLLAQMLLCFSSGILLFYNIALFFKKNSAFLATIFFWIFFEGFDFFNYTHQLVFPLIFLSLTGLFRYIKNPYKKTDQPKIIVFASCFLVGLVRINIGIALTIAYFLIFLIQDGLVFKHDQARKIKKNIFLFLLSLLAVAISYGPITFQLSNEKLFQCFPYFDSIYHSKLGFLEHLRLIIHYLAQTIDLSGLILGVICNISLGGILIYLIRKNPLKNKKIFLSLLISLAILWIFLSHEWLMGTHLYRILWLTPIHTTTAFFLIGFLFHKTKNVRSRHALFFMIAALFIWTFSEKQDEIKKYLVSENYVPHPKFHIFTADNSTLYPQVAHAGSFLKTRTIKNFQLLSIPFEPLYYYLLDLSSPAWNPMHSYPTRFLDTAEQELIQKMQEGTIQYIVISDSGYAWKFDSYQKFLKRYYQRGFVRNIEENYSLLKNFGEWGSAKTCLIGQSNVTTILKKRNQ